MFAAYGARTLASAKPYVPKEENVRIVKLVEVKRQREAERQAERKRVERTADQRLADDLVAKGRAAARDFALREAQALAEYRAKRLEAELSDFDLPRHFSSYRTIERRICRALKILPSEVKKSGRQRELTFARQAIMYWACRLTDYSYPQIGKRMGGRDHTTILSGKRAYVKKRALQGRTLREVR